MLDSCFKSIGERVFKDSKQLRPLKLVKSNYHILLESVNIGFETINGFVEFSCFCKADE